MQKFVKKFLLEAINIRHELHKIPELKYEEEKTSAYLAKTLTSYGYEIQRIAKTGLVALLDTKKPGKTIAFRADIDALAILESSGKEYKSCHYGKMHACGHDGHSATLLLVAKVLQQIKENLRGKIKLIFQPAEEGGKGSSLMIREGVLQNPEVEAIYAFHNWPGLELNLMATRSGAILAGSGRFEILLEGKRAHLSHPKDAINPVTIGAEIVKKIACLSREDTIINILGFNSGDWKQGTSLQTEIIGCYYISDEVSLNKLKENIRKIVGSYGRIEFHEFQYPTINTFSETELVFSAAKKIGIKYEKLEFCKMAGEDFSEFLKVVPGCYFLIGAGLNAYPLHTENYDFSDEIIPTAAQIFVQLAIDN